MYSILKDIIATKGMLAAAEGNAKHIGNVLRASKAGRISRQSAATIIRRRRKIWHDVTS